MRRNYKAACRRRIIAAALAAGVAPTPATAQFVTTSEDPVPSLLRLPVATLVSSYGAADGAASLGERLGLAVVVTSRQLARDLRGAGTIEQVAFGPVSAFAADIRQVSAGFRAGRAFTLDAAFTRLRERSSLLAMPSFDAVDPAGRAKTEGMTLGARWTLGPTIELSASGTIGRVRPGYGGGRIPAIGGGGLITSSFAAALTRSRLFGRSDRGRLSIAQPMFVERGAPGREGFAARASAWGRASRTFVSEILYARAVMGGGGEFSLFGRARLASAGESRTPALIGGGRMRLLF